MIAIGYARLSKKSEKSVSIEYQTDAIRKLADAQGYQLVAIEVDNGISGKNFDARPAAQRILDAVTMDKVDAVIVYRSDRFSRQGIEGLMARRLFDEHGVQYLSVTEGLLKYDIMGFVQEGMSREERIKISERTKDALAKKKTKGERIGCQLPYGQKVIKSEVVDVPAEKAIISRIKELRKDGLSTYKVTAAINAEGYATRKNTPFSRTQIVRILAA